jgi:hypothetical protein
MRNSSEKIFVFEKCIFLILAARMQQKSKKNQLQVDYNATNYYLFLPARHKRLMDQQCITVNAL